MVNSIVNNQNVFHSKLTTYINGGIFSRLDLYLSAIIPGAFFTRHAKDLIIQYERFINEIPSETNSKLPIQVEPYQGHNKYVHQMIDLVRAQLREDLIGAYVHGSLGTYEEIEYSDFDALVILKDEVFQSPKRLSAAAKKINLSRAIMLDFDPLQHHGWFILTGADLKCYCNAYFPYELFKYAKSLFEDKGLELHLCLRDSTFEIISVFEKMANAIICKIRNQQYPENLIQLKSLLSEFMLLPALYVQARNGKGFYKKGSFDLAKPDFESADWAIMDEVSKIRMEWNYEISPLRKSLMSHPYVLCRYFAKRFGPQIPERIGSALTTDFYSRMEKLALLMKDKLGLECI